MSTPLQTAAQALEAQPPAAPPRSSGKPGSGGANQLQKALKQHSRSPLLDCSVISSLSARSS
jgi:hypothetical protein